MWVLLAAAFLPLALAGCQGAAEREKAAQRTRVEQVFSALVEARSLLEDVGPAFESRGATLDPPLVLGETAVVAHGEDLIAPRQAMVLDLRTSLSEMLPRCARLLENGDASGSASSPGGLQLKQCASVRYVVVLRRQRYEAPVVDEGKRLLTPGSFEGDAVVLDLVARRVVGSFPLKVQNSSFQDVPTEPLAPQAARNLEAELTRSIERGLAEAFPRP
jgi:hypothetical protein